MVKDNRQDDLGHLMKKIFQEKARHPQLLVGVLREYWAEIVGEQLVEKTYPARVTKNLLWINAIDSSWAYQLQFMKEELLQSVQAFVEPGQIKDLRFQLGEVKTREAVADAEKTPLERLQPPPTERRVTRPQHTPGGDPQGGPGADIPPSETRERAPQPPPAASQPAKSPLDSAPPVLPPMPGQAAEAEPAADHKTDAAIEDNDLRDSFSRWRATFERRKAQREKP